MPRTKLGKNSKRNRESANEEIMAVLRDFEATSEQCLSKQDLKLKQERETLSNNVARIKNRIPEKMVNMKMGDLAAMIKIMTFSEFNKTMEEIPSQNGSTFNIHSFKSNMKKSKDDEGYLTEDSNLAHGQSSTSSNSRPMGPLCSAKAKARIRRSRTVSNYATQKFSTLSSSSSISNSIGSGINTEHISRSKLRNGGNVPNRVKAISADRANPVTPKFFANTPISMLRYPKFGETVISLAGSPVVVQGPPDPTANVNIPIKNGVISLRPTKMQPFDTDIITQIEDETLTQIKQLQSNLNLIMSYVNKS